MRIGILNWRDMEHPDAGGAEAFVQEVGTRWKAAGHDVTLYSSWRPGLSRLGDGSVRVKRIGRLARGTHHLLAPRLVARDQPDVVLESVSTLPYLLPSRRTTPPFLPLVHQLAVDVWHSHLPRGLSDLASWVEPRLYKGYRDVDVVAVSASTKRDLENAGLTRVNVVPQGGIGPQPLLEKEADPTFIFVGRLAANKRPDHVIEAFRDIQQRIPQAKLWMVGDGELHVRLQRDLPDRVTLFGRVSRRHLLDLMGRAHVLLVTSVREGWGLVVSEANALGTPAVAYRVPGLVDAVRSEVTGLLVEPHPRRLSEAAVRLVMDRSRYQTLRREAVRWGQTFTWERTARELGDELQRVVLANAEDAAIASGRSGGDGPS